MKPSKPVQYKVSLRAFRGWAGYSLMAPLSALSHREEAASHDSRPYRQVQSKLTETPYAAMFRACRSCRALGCNELVRRAFVGRSQDLSPPIATSISANRPPN